MTTKFNPADVVDGVISTIQPASKRRLLIHCVTGEVLVELAKHYNNPQSIFLTVNDDDPRILKQVLVGVTDVNSASRAYNENSDRIRLDLPMIPRLNYIGFSNSLDLQRVYAAIESHLICGDGDIRSNLGLADIAAGRIILVAPLLNQPIDLKVHVQDLRLENSVPGSEVIKTMDEMKSQGSLSGLHIVMAWSSLAAVRPQSTVPDALRTAENFYVFRVPKDSKSIELFESYAPSLLRDVLRSLVGDKELDLANKLSYRGGFTFPDY